MGIDAGGFAKANLHAYSHGKMLFLSINDKANKWKGKIKKYWTSVLILKNATNEAQIISTGWRPGLKTKRRKYIYWMLKTKWAKHNCLPNDGQQC